MEMMKKLLVVLVLGVLGYIGYQYDRGSALPVPSAVSSRLSASAIHAPTTDFLNVLGTTTSTLFAKGTDLLNNATAGQAEPVINKVVSDLQDKVKNLPQEEYKKVKAEFCRDVITSPEPMEEEQ